MFPLLPPRFGESELSSNISLVPKCSLTYSAKVLKERYSLAGLHSFYKKKMSRTNHSCVNDPFQFKTTIMQERLWQIRSARVMNEAPILCILPLSSCVQLFNWYLRNDNINSRFFIWLFYVQSSLLKRVWFGWSTPPHLPQFFISSLLNLNIVATYKKIGLSIAVMSKCRHISI